MKDNSKPAYFSDNDLADRFGVSRATPWRWSAQGKFPPPTKLSPGCTRWRRTDVEEWEEDPEEWVRKHSQKATA